MYASDGAQTQSVNVSYVQGLAKIVELVSEVDGDDLFRASNHVLHRISEGELIGRVVEFVASTLDPIYGHARCQLSDATAGVCVGLHDAFPVPASDGNAQRSVATAREGIADRRRAAGGAVRGTGAIAC